MMRAVYHMYVWDLPEYLDPCYVARVVGRLHMGFCLLVADMQILYVNCVNLFLEMS